MTRRPVHVLLLSSWPVLHLWAVNGREAAPSDAVAVLGVVMFVAALVMAAAVVVLRDAVRGGLLASVVMVVGLLYGHLLRYASASRALVAVALVVWALGVGIRRMGELRAAGLTRSLNVVGAVLVALAVFRLVPALGSEGTAARWERVEVAPTTTMSRDVLYIVPDRYARSDVLREMYGFDNAAFLDALRGRGFHVNESALANYPKTAHSLAATLNMDDLDGLGTVVGDGDRSRWAAVYGAFTDHVVGRAFVGMGYDYVHLGSWWQPTAWVATSTDVRSAGTSSEFGSRFMQTTIAPALLRVLHLPGGAMNRREEHRAHAQFQLAELARIAGERSERPRFIMVHLLLPHYPYVFATDGSEVSRQEESSRGREGAYVDQLQWLNGELLNVVDGFLDRSVDEQPIIILQADEGPHPIGYLRQGEDYRWDKAPAEDLLLKLAILSAAYWPGVDADEIPDVSAVNTFRVILDRFAGAGLGLVPDRAFVYPDEHDLYTFVDVTARVR